MVDGVISAARLDRFYLSHGFSNRLRYSYIYLVGLTGHHLVTFDSFYWHFNVKLLQDTGFRRRFEVFWGIWRGRKGDFVSGGRWVKHTSEFSVSSTYHSVDLKPSFLRKLIFSNF